VRSRSLGITPASESLVALIRIMNRIGNLLSFFKPGYYLDPLLESLLTPIIA